MPPPCPHPHPHGMTPRPTFPHLPPAPAPPPCFPQGRHRHQPQPAAPHARRVCRAGPGDEEAGRAGDNGGGGARAGSPPHHQQPPPRCRQHPRVGARTHAHKPVHVAHALARTPLLRCVGRPCPSPGSRTSHTRPHAPRPPPPQGATWLTPAKTGTVKSRDAINYLAKVVG